MAIQDIQVRNAQGEFEKLTLPIANGGTGADNAADARTNLGVTVYKGVGKENGSFVGVSGDGVTEIGKYLDFHTKADSDFDLRIEAGTNDTWFSKPLRVDSGGTGARNATDARKNLQAALSVDGVVAAESHGLTQNPAFRYDYAGVLYHQQSGPESVTAGENNTPTNTWWHILRFCHPNSDKYYTDLAIPFIDMNKGLQYKQVVQGQVSYSRWIPILDLANYEQYTYTKNGGTCANIQIVTNNLNSTNTGIHLAAVDNTKSVYLHGKDVGCWNNGTTSYVPMFASAFFNSSSGKLKENIQDLDDTYAEKILNIRPVTFEYINDETHSEQTGVIAEEVKDIVPEAFHQSYDDELEREIIGIDYSKFIPRLMKLAQIERKSQEDIDEAVVTLYEQQQTQQIETDLALTSIYESMIGGE